MQEVRNLTEPGLEEINTLTLANSAMTAILQTEMGVIAIDRRNQGSLETIVRCQVIDIQFVEMDTGSKQKEKSEMITIMLMMMAEALYVKLKQIMFDLMQLELTIVPQFIQLQK